MWSQVHLSHIEQERQTLLSESKIHPEFTILERTRAEEAKHISSFINSLAFPVLFSLFVPLPGGHHRS